MNIDLAYSQLCEAREQSEFPLEVHRELESTQRYLAEHLDSAVVVAVQQSQGQGRMGRSWSSPPGGLWLSLVYPTARVEGLSLAVGLAVVRLLQAHGVRPWMRWPNDVLVGDKKLAGILVDARWSGERATALVGIGLNVDIDPLSLPSELQGLAGSLTDYGVDRPHLGQVLLQLLTHWKAVSALYEQSGLSELWSELRELVGQGQRVAVRENGQKYIDRIAGLEKDGSLKLASGRILYSVERLEILKD